MISKLLIVDSNLSESTRGLLNSLINNTNTVLFSCDYSKGDIVNNINNFISSNSSYYIKSICFFNIIIDKTNLFTYNYNNDFSVIHDAKNIPNNVNKSWSFIPNITNVVKNLESIDFIDINHLAYYKDYINLFEKIKLTTTVNINYLSDLFEYSEEKYNNIFENNNIIKELLFNLNEGNISTLINKYFIVNDIIKNSLNDVILNEITISKEDSSVLYDASHCYIEEGLNIFIIPLNIHMNNISYLSDILYEASESFNTCFEFIYPEDTISTLFTRLKIKIINHCGKRIVDIHNVNVAIWLKPDLYSTMPNTFYLSKNINLHMNNNGKDNELKFFINNVKNIVEVAKKGSISSINFELMNGGKIYNPLYDDVIHAFYKDKIINNKKVNCYKTYYISNYDESDISSNNKIINHDIKLLKYKHERYHKLSSYLTSVDIEDYPYFLEENIIENVILYDLSLKKHLKYIKDSILPNTITVNFNSDTDSFEDIKYKLLKISEKNNIELKNVSIMQHNRNYLDNYTVLKEETGILKDIDLIDPSLNSWSLFKDFVLFLQDDIGVYNLDLLMCNIYSNYNWKYIIDKINEETPNITIRSSEDVTGHTLFDGDWILESPGIDVNLVGVYFNKKILDLSIKLENNPNIIYGNVPVYPKLSKDGVDLPTNLYTDENGDEYISYKITEVGAFTYVLDNPIVNSDVLLVGGGGGTGGKASDNNQFSGGGGGGGVLEATQHPLVAGEYKIQIGYGALRTNNSVGLVGGVTHIVSKTSAPVGDYNLWYGNNDTDFIKQVHKHFGTSNIPLYVFGGGCGGGRTSYATDGRGACGAGKGVGTLQLYSPSNPQSPLVPICRSNNHSVGYIFKQSGIHPHGQTAIASNGSNFFNITLRGTPPDTVGGNTSGTSTGHVLWPVRSSSYWNTRTVSYAYEVNHMLYPGYNNIKLYGSTGGGVHAGLSRAVLGGGLGGGGAGSPGEGKSSTSNANGGKNGGDGRPNSFETGNVQYYGGGGGGGAYATGPGGEGSQIYGYGGSGGLGGGGDGGGRVAGSGGQWWTVNGSGATHGLDEYGGGAGGIDTKSWVGWRRHGGNGVAVIRFKTAENKTFQSVPLDVAFSGNSILTGDSTTNRLESFVVNLSSNMSFTDTDISCVNGAIINFTKVNIFSYSFDVVASTPNTETRIFLNPASAYYGTLDTLAFTFTWSYTYPVKTITDDSTGLDISIHSTYIDDNGDEYVSMTITDVGTKTITLDNSINDVDFMIVAGGGGGNGGGAGQGGGSGGVVIGTGLELGVGQYTITVGDGGAGGTSASSWAAESGANSEAFGYIAIGGGRGGGTNNNGANGGSGGGNDGGNYGRSVGYHSDTEIFEFTGGSANYNNDSSAYPDVMIYGNNGGGHNSSLNGTNGTSAGGGGAGGAGGTGNNPNYHSGAGGVGMTNNFLNGVDKYYAGGGGGGNLHVGYNEGAGGNGGGGAGGDVPSSGSYVNDGISGTPNTGGGGGGASAGNGGSGANGGSGGSGVVIIRYKTSTNINSSLPSGLSFSSSALDENNETSSGLIDVDLLNTDFDLSVITESDLTVNGGSIVTFTKINNLKYRARVSANAPGSNVSIMIPKNRLYNSVTGSRSHDKSNVLSWNWNYSIVPPDIVISSVDVSNNAVSSTSSIDLELKITNDNLGGNSVVSSIVKEDLTVTNGDVYKIEVVDNQTIRFGARTTSQTGQTVSIKLNENKLSRLFNNVYSVKSNNESNIFNWSYTAADLVINSFEGSNSLVTNGHVNTSTVWFRLVFSEDVFNFNKEYITGTNCTVDKIIGSGDRYSVKCTTYEPTSASIQIANNINITTGVGFETNIQGNNLVFNWNYDDTPPTIDFAGSHVNNSTNNNSSLDITITSSQDIKNFSQSSIIITGSATITSFTQVSTKVYDITVTPTSASTISITLDDDLTDIYGNSYVSIPVYNWTYDNVVPTIFITSGDLNDGETSSDDSITVNFITNKEIFNFNLADDAFITNGILSNLEKLTNVSVQNTFNVTVNSKTTEHPLYYGGGNGYYIDGDESPELNLIIGNTYVFNQEDSTNATHPLLFYEDVDRTKLYSKNIFVNGAAGSENSYTSIRITNATPKILYYQCGNHSYMGNYISVAHNEKYRAVLKPTVNNSLITLYIKEDSFEDHVGNLNSSDSNIFEWNFSGNNLLSVLSTTDVSNGGIRGSPSIDMTVTFTSDITSFDSNDISFTNGSIDNISSIDDRTKTFTYTSSTFNTESTIFIPENSVTTGAVDNKESNIFSWTWTIVIPSVTISSSIVDNGGITNNNSIPFTFTLNDPNIAFLENDITVTNGTIDSYDDTNSSSGIYTCNIIPSISVGQLKVKVSEGSLIYNQNGVPYENDISFNYDISYDGVEPTLTLTTNDVDEDASTNRQEVQMLLTSNKNINNLRISDIYVSNGVAHSLSDSSGSSFKFIVKAFNNKVDNNIEVYIKSNSIVDDVGNLNSSASNQYDFTINARVSKKKSSNEMRTTFTSVGDIPAEEIPSESEINLVISAAFTIPDTSDPFAEETTETTTSARSIPKITIPPQVTIKNTKVFSALIDQIFEAAEDVGTIKIDKNAMALTSEASEKIAAVEEVVLVKSNQTTPIDFSSVQEDPTKESAVYIPLANAGDFIRITISSIEYEVVSNGDGTFDLIQDNTTNLGIFNSGDVYPLNDLGTQNFIFGSLIVSSEATEATLDNPCFLKGTEILTKNGYKNIENLIKSKDILIDHEGNELRIRDVKRFIRKNDNTEYPHKIPKDSKLSEDFIVTKDLYITHNHCLYLPHVNKYVPVSMMKHIKEEISDVEHFVYYHIYTDNYFSDTIIANGIPCETHSKYIFERINNLDNSKKIFNKLCKKIDMQPNCQRSRITNKELNKFLKKNKNKNKKK